MVSPSRSHMPALIFLLLIPTVNSQTQNIVSVSSIKDQVPFTITCAVNRVKMPAQAANLQNIFGLQIHINTNSTADRNLATYVAGAVGGAVQIQNVTAGRNWVVSFSGDNGGLNNRDTIKIEVLVKDAMCTDAGTYTCNVLDLMAPTHPITNSQNVSAEAAISDLILSPRPIHTGSVPAINYSMYDLNETVTITCQVNGPSNLALKWRYEQKPTCSLGPSLVDYPVANDITTSPVEQMGTGTCPKYHYASELKITITELDVMRIYMCVIQENGVDLANISVTVDVTLPESSQIQDILSVKSIKYQVPFLITCAVNRVRMIPADVQDIFGLIIRINTNATADRVLAEYTVGIVNKPPIQFQNIPPGRNWITTYSGGNGGINNRDTIKIEVLVKDAMPSDAGRYTCIVQYYTDRSQSVSNSQDVSA